MKGDTFTDQDRLTAAAGLLLDLSDIVNARGIPSLKGKAFRAQVRRLREVGDVLDVLGALERWRESTNNREAG